MSILLVEDDEDDRMFFADALESLKLNCELHQVPNGKSCLEFVERAAENGPDLIFLDLNMPTMNGAKCLEQIRQNENMRDVMIAIYSTSDAEKDIEKTYSLGADLYVKKPSSFKDLKSLLKKVITTQWKRPLSTKKKEDFVFKV